MRSRGRVGAPTLGLPSQEVSMHASPYRALAAVLIQFLAVGLAAAQQRPEVRVSTVRQLYQAVNNPAHQGVTVVLETGTYVLDPAADVNLGRLELQPDMGLRGAGGNAADTVIDAH